MDNSRSVPRYESFNSSNCGTTVNLVLKKADELRRLTIILAESRLKGINLKTELEHIQDIINSSLENVKSAKNRLGVSVNAATRSKIVEEEEKATGETPSRVSSEGKVALAKPANHPPLTSAMDSCICEAVQKPSNNNKKERVTDNVNRESMHTLADGGFVDGDIANETFRLIEDRYEKYQKLIPVYGMQDSFFPCLQTWGVDEAITQVKNLIGEDGLKVMRSRQLFLIPVHIDKPKHWTLAVADLREMRLSYYDSLSDEFTKRETDYYDKWREKLTLLGKFFSKLLDLPYNWIYKLETSPQQNNGEDCGVFMLTNADYVSTGHRPDYKQEHIRYLRKIRAWEILNVCMVRFDL